MVNATVAADFEFALSCRAHRCPLATISLSLFADQFMQVSSMLHKFSGGISRIPASSRFSKYLKIQKNQ
jgi:hypothetical protein